MPHGNNRHPSAYHREGCPSPRRGRYAVSQSDWSRDRPLTFEGLVAQMDAAGVAKAAIVQASTYYGFDNSYVANCTSRPTRRFTGVYSVDVFASDAIAVIEGMDAARPGWLAALYRRLGSRCRCRTGYG